MDRLQTTFLNENGREYDVKVSVPIAHEFCRVNGIKLEGLNPLLLDIAQLIDLAYMATRSSKMQALGETKDQFLEGLEGESFSRCQDCAVNALVNFSLRVLPKDQAAILRAEVEKVLAVTGGGQDSSESPEDLGSGGTSSDSAEA